MKDHTLVTTGIYSLVRHPAYAAGIIVTIGISLCQLSDGSLWTSYGTKSWISLLSILECIHSALLATITILRVSKEDRMLKATFTKEWITYARNTPYKLFPYVYWIPFRIVDQLLYILSVIIFALRLTDKVYSSTSFIAFPFFEYTLVQVTLLFEFLHVPYVPRFKSWNPSFLRSQ